MSRYEPKAHADAVHRDNDNVDDEHREILWIGTSYGEIADPKTVIAAIDPFADVDADLAATLHADRLREGHRPHSPWIR
jgi:plasmid stability protein